MGFLTLPSALAVCALTLHPHGAVERARQFANSLGAWGAVCGGGVGEVGAQRLYAKYLELWGADRFAEARDVVRAFLDVRTRMNGEDHFQTRSARSSVTVAEHVAALPAA